MIDKTWDKLPPGGAAKERGWHWLRTPSHGPVLCLWAEHAGREGDWRWHYEGGHDISDASLVVSEWRYVAPAVPPAS